MSAALIAASTLGNIVERIGAYAGLASMIGLGVLSLLYFAQAREVKRLREWAGRAPERAAEVEQRVQADAQRRVIAQPQTPAGQVAATPAAAAPPARLPTAGLTGEAATRAAAAAIVAARSANPPQSIPAPGQLARSPLPPADAGTPDGPAAAATQGGAAPASAQPSAGGAPSAPGAVQSTPGTQSGAGNAQPPALPSPTPATPGLGSPAPAMPSAPATATPGLGSPAPAMPSAPAPAPAKPVTNAAVSAALAASRPTATTSSPPARAAMPRVVAHPPASANGGQETRESAAARPLPPPVRAQRTDPTARSSDDGEGRSWGRGFAIVVGVLGLVLVVGVIILLAGGGGSTKNPTSRLGTGSPSQPASKAIGSRSQAATVVPAETTTSVLNGTTQAGLASSVAAKLDKAGFKKPQTGDNVDQTLARTVVYFTAGNQRAAEAVAKVIGVSTAAVKPIDRNVAVSSSGAQVVVTVGADLSG